MIVENAFNEFEAATYPALGISNPEQRRQIGEAFRAGALWMFTEVYHRANTLSEDEAERFLKELVKEFDGLRRKLKGGE